MDERLLSELAKTRSRLNAAILAHRAFAWALPAGLAAGALVALLRSLGMEAAGYPLWLSLVLAAACAGALAATSSRLGEAQAARWLDAMLEDGELVSSALLCRERGYSGPFDAEVARRAEGLLARIAILRPSLRPLAKKASFAAASLLIGAYLVFLSSPPGPASPRQGVPSPVAATDRVPASNTALKALSEGGAAAASAFADSLFPNDRRRATLAERALREGRTQDLKDMLRAADLEYGSRMAGSVSETERKRLAEDRQRIQEAARALSMDYRAGRGGVGQNPGDGGGGPEGGAGGEGRQPGSQGGGPGSGAGGGGTGLTRLKSEEEGGQLGSSSPEGGDGSSGSGGYGSSARGADKGGGGYGSGPGSEGSWGPIRPAAGPGTVVLNPDQESSFFELVLPGQSSTKPVGELVPDLKRSAESAMSREDLPFEYEDFVSSYFLSLSKGESR